MSKEKNELLEEIRAVKMLLILQLLRQGVKQGHIAAILSVSEATMIRMLPKGMAKNVSKGNTPSAAEGVE